MKRLRFILLLVLLYAVAGCERISFGDNAAPSGSMVKILSTSPETSTPLYVGDRVKLWVDVAYTLTTDSGTVDLVVQAADNSGLAHDMEVIRKGSGQTHFETEFVVPNTKAIQLFVPLSAKSQSTTSTVDMWAFKVVSK